MKKAVSLVLVFLMVLSLTACAKEENIVSTDYIISDFEKLPETITEISNAQIFDESVYLCCHEEADENNESHYIGVISADGSLNKLKLNERPDEKLLNMCLDSNGNIWCLYENSEYNYSLKKYSLDGSPLSEIPLNESFSAADLNGSADFYLNTDKNLNLCITAKNIKTYCFIFDKDGKLLFTLEDAGNPLTAINLNDGTVAVCSSADGGWTYKLKAIDMEEQSWGKELEIGTVEKVFSGAKDTDFFLYDSSDLYSCSFDSQQKKQIFNWTGLGLASADSYVCPMSDDSYAVISSMFSQTGLKRYEYCIVKEGKDERTALSMLSLQPDSSVLDAVANFNKSNPDYRVELRTYFPMNEDVSDDEWEKAIMKLNAELISGEVPDIIDLAHMPVDVYTSKGILEDLYPYIQNDTVISENDYFDNVFNALSINGKLSYVTSNVMLMTMFADSELMGEKQGWTADEFQEFKMSADDAVGNIPPEFLMELLLSSDMGFVDWESGECSFDSPKFISMLELVKSAGEGNETYVMSDGSAENPASCVCVNAASIFDIALYNAFFNGNATPIGYPGTGEPLHILSPINMIGISATGEHKDAAWTFARSILEEEQQEAGLFFPIRKDSFDMMMAAAVKGQSIWAGQAYIGEIKEEDITLAKKLLNTAKYSLSSDDGLITLVLKEAAPYFEGSKTAQEAAADIQSKVQIYVDEHR